ncbi:hypothetical protein D3C81_1115960 [compost metagenome]
MVKLKNKTNMFISESTELFSIQFLNINTIDGNRSLIWLIQGTNDVQQCTFTSS